ncbi:serine aminopeptidase domain-containing protein [Rhodococcus marinonascens]|uniref:serine aminopeptidase domain-containing protein n=1 Tax=Rhodococcus marinonascens TaxID=38311 RepID=UPI000932F57E|nr:alpha/beta hydrolase [Rhodococcus marinonascens]
MTLRPDIGCNTSRGGRSDGTRFATWFGAEDTPLFGVVDLPAERKCRGAVVLCPPIGKEQVDAYRGLVYLAERLRSHGLLVLRFDYRGTGDSAGNQDDPDAVAGWLDSIRTAVGYVRKCGITDIGLVGLRVGALLAAQVAATCGPVRALALWDPVQRGRAYVRKQTVLRQMVAGAEAEDDPRVTLIGTVLAPAAAAGLSAMSLQSAIPPPGARVLMALRQSESDSKVTSESVATWNCDELIVRDHELFLEPQDFMVQTPFDDIDRIAAWMASSFGDSLIDADLDICTTAAVDRTADGRQMVETLGFAGASELFTICTSVAAVPDSQVIGASATPTVIFHGTANEHRVGPVRLWVEAARELAAHGIVSVRFDRRGTGDTGVVPYGECTTTYTDESRADAVEVISVSGAQPDSLVLAGMCSGAWHSSYAALQRPVRAVVLVNMADWAVTRKAFVKQSMVSADQKSPKGRALGLLHRNAAETKKHLRSWLPYRGWMWLGRAGLLQVPELMLGPLNDRGVRTTLLFSPGDYASFTANSGERSIRRLRRAGWKGRLVTYRTGDHSLYSTALREQILPDVVATVLGEFAEDRADGFPGESRSALVG